MCGTNHAAYCRIHLNLKLIRMRLRVSGTTLLAVFVILLFGSFSALAPEPDFGGSVINYFQTIGKTPQEKLYLHLDKPYYGAGEEIWFRGYLLNAITHMDNSPSNYIYVELTDRGDSVLQRFKFRRDSLGFRGSIPLPADLPAGGDTPVGCRIPIRHFSTDTACKSAIPSSPISFRK